MVWHIKASQDKEQVYSESLMNIIQFSPRRTTVLKKCEMPFIGSSSSICPVTAKLRHRMEFCHYFSLILVDYLILLL